MLPCMDTSIRAVLDLLISFGYDEHIDMIEPLRHGEATVVHISSDGVLARHREGVWFASVRTDAAARNVLDLVDGDDVFCTHGEVGLELFLEHLGRPEVMHCRQVLLKKPISEAFLSMEQSEYTLSPLNPSHLDLVVAQYHTAPPAYVLGRLRAGAMLGAWVGDELAGFIGTHAEGSIGLLKVVPKFRRRGLATLLESEICRRLQAAGRVPYGQVFIGNDASMALQRKIGFTCAASTVHWLDRADC